MLRCCVAAAVRARATTATTTAFMQTSRSYASRHSTRIGRGRLAANTRTAVMDDLQFLPVIFVKATFNNTVVSASDHEGVTLALSSGGTVGFKNSRKKTPFAAEAAGQAVGQVLKEKYHIDRVIAKIKGLGVGRSNALKGVQKAGIRIEAISDCTPIPHNGCRPKSKRRV